MMKKNTIIAFAALFLLVSCGTYTGAGASAGAYWGQSIGGAIGGISSGHRGYHTGSLIGMASGAIIGAAIGSAADKKQEQEMDKYYAEKDRLAQNRYDRQHNNYDYDSGYDSSNSGDDRLYDFELGSPYDAPQSPHGTANIEVRGARFVDANHDNMIGRGERCKVVFEVFNRGKSTIYNVQPMVVEASGNKHVFVSQNATIESLAPGHGIKYTANVVGDTRLGNGKAKLLVSVFVDGKQVTKVSEFNISTTKR